MFWSSSYEINVDTSVSRVVEDNQLPETIKSSVLEAVLRGQEITNTILESALNGPSPSFNRMFEYAKDHYPYGLPNSTVSNTTQGKPEVVAAIEQETGRTVTLESMFLDGIDNVFMGWKEITENYGYDRVQNTLPVLSAQVGFTVYLDTILAVHKVEGGEYGGYYESNSDEVTEAGYTPERAAQAPGTLIGNKNITEEYLEGGEDGVLIRTVYENGEKELVKQDIFVSLAQYDRNDAYFHARYSYGSGNQTGYWLYKDNSGTYPALDEIHNARYSSAGTFFPFIFFRHYSQNLTHSSQHDTDRYKASVRMLDIINMDYQEIGDSVHENPDVDDIEQATMMMGIPINSQHETDLRYLFLFFNRLHTQTTNEASGISATGGRFNYGVKNNNAITVQDADFKFVLSYGNINKRFVAGKIGNIGTHSGGLTSFKYKTVISYRDNDGDRQTRNVTIDVPQRYFRRQISNVMYEEIKVTNPKMVFVVYEKSSSDVYNVAVDSSDDRMLVPLDKDLADKYSLVEQEDLYFRALHFVVNAKVERKVEWYETGFFKAVLFIAAAAMFIAFPPSGAPLLMTALGLGATTGAVWLVLAVVFTVLQGVLISYVFKLVLQELDIENAFIVAVIAAVAAIAAGQFQELAFLADDLLLVASGINAGFSLYVKDQMEGLRDLHDAFSLEAEEKWEELEEVNNLLDVDTMLDPFAFIGLEPIYIPNEGPDAFYKRTIDSGNIGTLVFDQLENFVDNSLTLPDINDTLEGEFYV